MQAFGDAESGGATRIFAIDLKSGKVFVPATSSQ